MASVIDPQSSNPLGDTKASLSDSSEAAMRFTRRCVFIDLEVGIRDGRIHQLAAVRPDINRAFSYARGSLQTALEELEQFAQGSQFLLGHNLITFDIPHLSAVRPNLALLSLPPLDTLQLNPLAFPRNPYHHLVKHYKDGKLQGGTRNNPELDARLALNLLSDQFDAFAAAEESNPDLLLAWHWLLTLDKNSFAINAFFSAIRSQPRPGREQAISAIKRCLQGRACSSSSQQMLDSIEQDGWAIAYVLAWLSVAGGNSVMPPWVRHQVPAATEWVHKLRDLACGGSQCKWCCERHDARKELKRWYKFDNFRAEPKDTDGKSLQGSIVEAAMRGEHVLGILPTGAGKSLCYQVPAISRYYKTGALTVVISPLVALMQDQMRGMEARDITCCAAVNGMLSMPERADVLDRTRLGDIGILIISPEQLRNRALRRVLKLREIGAWVLDEAHCLSKWGHDFRPDYRYVGRFIKESASANKIAPVLCLTATAKLDVVEEIQAYFRDKVGVTLQLLDGGAERTNLEYFFVQTSPAGKFSKIYGLLCEQLPEDQPGGAIVYCASRKQAEEVAQFLRDKDVRAEHFHAGLQPESRKTIQARFISGELRAIAATNAFGMGIDKPDVRLVIHADIPGSLENYLQEAGRAGRDRENAKCVLLYTPEDVERQFSMSARSRLSRVEIQAILKSLRRLDRKKRLDGEVIVTTGELLVEEVENAFQRDSTTDDTRVRTAISWLEEAHLLKREENQVQVFPSSLRVNSVEEARKKLEKRDVFNQHRQQLLMVVKALIEADGDEGISTDELAGISGLGPDKMRAAMYDLEQYGIAVNDTAITAFVHRGVENTSAKRFKAAAELESALIEKMRELAPGLEIGEPSVMHLRIAAQRLRDAGCKNALPDTIWRLLRSLSFDGRNEDGGIGSLRLRKLGAETVRITLQRDWDKLAEPALRRRAASRLLLNHFLDSLPKDARGVDLLAETTMGGLNKALEQDGVIKAQTKDLRKLLDRALLWLHEQDVLRLNKGLAVFRPAMTIQLAAEKRNFVKADFKPLEFHYTEQVMQIHVMHEYVLRGLAAIADALQLTLDYFTLNRTEFLTRWLPNRQKEIARQTTPESWKSVVEDLKNPEQQSIVADDREQTHVLVLAGPGSGKTRVLVHRIAYLVRVRRENPRGILALAYNRHAALEIRRRLQLLIGDDSRGVTILTCHALAMRLAGVSFTGRASTAGTADFDQILQRAVALLRGDGLEPDDADVQRERLLAGFRWILVDEYQDISCLQYELISALAGRTQEDKDSKLSLFAVGDDDQNIYAFAGASVEFIRKFEVDYSARSRFLVENYRSSRHIINAANSFIALAGNRMKRDQPIRINEQRSGLPAGGDWESIDPAGKGRVQVLAAGATAVSQAIAAVTELCRLAELAPQWDWSGCAIIAREWRWLEPVRSYCEINNIAVQMAYEQNLHFFRLRETQALVTWVKGRRERLVNTSALKSWLATQPAGAWWTQLDNAIDDWSVDTANAEVSTQQFIEWLVEWGREMRTRQDGLLLLTAHRAKGLEFDHVIVLDGAWEKTGEKDDPDASRRLYYVAMTRARKTLALARLDSGNPIMMALQDAPGVLIREPVVYSCSAPGLKRRYVRLSPGDVDLGFAGRYSRSHQVHRHIANLKAGDALTLDVENGKHVLLDATGNVVGRLAKQYKGPNGMRCVDITVAAIMIRNKEDSAELDLQVHCRCEQWETVIPEIIYEPVSAFPETRSI